MTDSVATAPYGSVPIPVQLWGCNCTIWGKSPDSGAWDHIVVVSEGLSRNNPSRYFGHTHTCWPFTAGHRPPANSIVSHSCPYRCNTLFLPLFCVRESFDSFCASVASRYSFVWWYLRRSSLRQRLPGADSWQYSTRA